MKTLRRLCATFVLALALALSAFAGEIQTTVVSQPPPPESQVTTTGEISTGVTGEMTTGITGEISTSVAGQIDTGVTDVALSLLQSVLSLF
jgi:hypothetical protein